MVLVHILSSMQILTKKKRVIQSCKVDKLDWSIFFISVLFSFVIKEKVGEWGERKDCIRDLDKLRKILFQFFYFLSRIERLSKLEMIEPIFVPQIGLLCTDNDWEFSVKSNKKGWLFKNVILLVKA